MSAIHKALADTEKQNTIKPTASFNPLSQRNAKKTNWLYTFIGIGFLVAAGALLLWPKTVDNRTAINTAQPSSSANDDQVRPSVNAPMVTASDDVASEPLQETIPEPAAGNQVTAEPLPTDLPTDLSTEIPAEPPAQEVVKAVAAPTKAVDSASPRPATTADKATTPPKRNTSQTNSPTVASTVVKSTSTTPIKTSTTASTITPAKTTEPVTNTTSSVVRQQTNLWQKNTQNYIEKGDIEQAEAELKQWISASPNDLAPRLWLAKIYMNNGFYRAAEPLINQSPEKDAKALLGVIYERTERANLAATLFEELYRSHPREGKWLLFWAINAENSGQLAKSLVLYQNYLQVFSLDDEKLTSFAEQRVNSLQGQ